MSDIVVEKFTEWEPAWQIMNAVDDPDYIIEATTEYLEETPLAAAHFIDRSVTVNMVMHMVFSVHLGNRLLDNWVMTDYPFDSRIVQGQICNTGTDASDTTLTAFTLASSPSNGVNMGSAAAAAWSYTEDVTDKIPGSWSGSVFTCTKAYATSSTATTVVPCLQLDIPIDRKAHFIFIEKIISLWLCEVAAYFSFRVPITVAMPRFAACMIAFLTAATIQRTVQGSLPSSADLCFLMMYVTQQMYIVMMSCAHSMVMFRVNKDSGIMAVQRYDRIAQVMFLVYWILAWPIAWLLSVGTTAGYAGGVILSIATHLLLFGLYHNSHSLDWFFDGLPCASKRPTTTETTTTKAPEAVPGSSKVDEEVEAKVTAPPDRTHIANVADCPTGGAARLLPPIVGIGGNAQVHPETH